MRNFKYGLYGYIVFFFTVAFNVSAGIIVYKLAEEESMFIVVLAIFGICLASAALCSTIDYIRRKIMIDRPLQDILHATKLMSRGNFKIRLIPHHRYEDYDEFDLIKEDLNNMAKELSKSEVLKTDFIANVSHEIKTPVSVILNYAKALEDKTLDEKMKNKYLSSLQDACRKMSTLVTNILKLNKLENQKLEPEFKRFNLSESISSSILNFEDIIEKKKINLECDIEEDLLINSEESYLELVWNNLISNAIKFSDVEGNIKISLKKINDEYIVKVSDNGCGMDKETGKHIFDKFYQGDTSHQKEGNGLGLPLVKKVIDILGGSIRVESEVNVGTTFTITIKEV